MRKGKFITFINVLLVIATVVTLIVAINLTWMKTILESSQGDIQSKYTLWKCRLEGSFGGILVDQKIDLSDLCGWFEDESNIFCAVYKSSVLVMYLTFTGFAISVFNLVITLTFACCVNGGTKCFKASSIILSFLTFCLYLGSLVQYSVRVSGEGNVKYQSGWGIYLMGCVISLVSVVLSTFSSNVSTYVFLSEEFEIK